MAYAYDIFISYKRHPETLSWIKQHFLPLLELRVGLYLGRDPTVFVNEINQQIPVGTAWPEFLGKTLSESRVLIALWTKTYFNSVWCAKELSHMLSREREKGQRPNGDRYGLVIPVVIHDGESFPEELNYIQRMDIKCCYNTRMRLDSPKAEELSEVIDRHAGGIASAIEQAPAWQPEWQTATAEEFFATYYRAEAPIQTVVPRFQAQ